LYLKTGNRKRYNYLAQKLTHRCF